MSELSKSRVSTAIAIVAATVAVVAVALPGVGFGQTRHKSGRPTADFPLPNRCETRSASLLWSVRVRRGTRNPQSSSSSPCDSPTGCR
jgi:hypothetical protein